MRPTLLVPVILAALCLGSCATAVTRSPVAEEKLAIARPYGIDTTALRFYGDLITAEELEPGLKIQVQNFRERYAREIAAGRPIKADTLLLSGGGPDGAFGAGILNGWTQRGDRPTFQNVTGISTGAIIAPFAYLGSKYDPVIEEIYTAYDTDDFVRRNVIAGLFGGVALADTSGLRSLIERYADDALITEIAAEYQKGRLLLIGTTNIDASRPVLWNIGAIAASGHPDAKRLIHDVIQASAAIPVAFPPVLIPVEADGKTYDEMHVDGGATQQVALFSPSVSLKEVDRRVGTRIDRTFYIIVNQKAEKPYEPVEPRVAEVAGASISSLIGGSGSGDIYKIFSIAQRDGAKLRVVAIPKDFDVEWDEPFDPQYMRALFDLGVEMGRRGDEWRTYPFGYVP